jgi:transcriptional regulator of acetoin/glycerol metabolism
MMLPEGLRQKLLAATAMPPSEQELMLDALSSTNWNKSKAARRLQWSRMTLYRKLAKYDLDRTEPAKSTAPGG